jgi:tetratricopeptide (TPR) repeat protein
MEKSKDNIALAVSIMAFVLSLFATVLGELRAKADQQREVRSQLTEVLRGLMSLQVEHAKLVHESREDPMYQTAGRAALGQQNGFLLDQAVYLADQIPQLVTAYEYNTIAVSSFNAGNPLVAERYYRKAADVAHAPIYKAQAIRSYAAYLFSQRRFAEGREQFEKALRQVRDDSNLTHQTNGMTYQLWAWNEKHLAHAGTQAQGLYAKAGEAFRRINVDFLRDSMIQQLEWEQTNREWAPMFNRIPGTGIVSPTASTDARR